jgi:CubicO group peptidase (beta-lactamase class C family)
MTRVRIALCAVLAGAASAPAWTQSPPPAPRPAPLGGEALRKRIDAYLQAFVADGHLSGTLLVARGNEVQYERSFGMANYELGVPNRPDTRFCIASITKPITVMMAAQMLAEKKLALSDPLEKWIPGFPDGARITIDHLLNHRAGIPHRVTTAAEESVPHTPADVVELARKQRLLFVPGEQSSYSSAGYTVLTRVLELAAGAPYEQVLAERVVKPARLQDTVHASSRVVVPRRASSYVLGPDGVKNSPLIDVSFLAGAGSLFSTPADLFRLLLAVREGKLGESARLSVTSRPRVAWNGNTSGFRAFFDSDPATGLTVAFAGNMMSGAIDRLRADLPRLLAGEVVADPQRVRPNTVRLDPALLARYAGDYLLGGTTPFTVVVDGNTLETGGRILVPVSETSFFSYADYGTVKVVTKADGRVERLDWVLPDTVIACPRAGATTPTAP